MELFDILDEVAGKQVLKTDTGDNRVFGVMPGVVVKNYDVEMKGRVCVRLPMREEGANELKWARVAMPYAGKSRGVYFLPEVGDQVLVCFEQGNLEKAYVIGSIPKERDGILTTTADEKNRFKRIVAKNGSALAFEDGEPEDGGDDQVALYTARSGHRLILDNGKHTITLGDKKADNAVVMRTEQGRMDITAQNRLTLRVGENIEVTMNASSGTVSVKCGKLTLEAGNGCSVESGGSLKLTAANVDIEAASALRAEAGSVARFGGAATQIGKR